MGRFGRRIADVFPDLNRIVFTKHALSRFDERYRVINPSTKMSDPEKTARKLLKGAREDKQYRRSFHATVRLVHHSGQEVQYFIANGWRFVIRTENATGIVLTIEHPDFI